MKLTKSQEIGADEVEFGRAVVGVRVLEQLVHGGLHAWVGHGHGEAPRGDGLRVDEVRVFVGAPGRDGDVGGLVQLVLGNNLHLRVPGGREVLEQEEDGKYDPDRGLGI